MKSSFSILRRLTALSALLGLCSGASAQIVTWSQAGLPNINWSDPTNWTGGIVPGAANTAYFDNNGVSTSAGALNVDNIVDANFTVSSLWYAETNPSPTFAYHNTVINSGTTLTVSNTSTSIMLDSGTQTDPDTGNTSCYNTISGGGTLDVNNTNSASVIITSQGSSTYTGDAGLWATLDMSGLGTFRATTGRLLVGIQGVGATAGQVALVNSGRQSGILSLAETNIINLTQAGNIQGTGSAAAAGAALVINDSPFFGDYGSAMYLGQSNALFADTITVGRIQCSRTAIFEFNNNLPGPFELYLRGESSNRVSEFVVGDDTQNGGFCNAPPGSGIVVPPGGFQVGSAGLVDVSAGTSDMMIDTLILGKGFNGGGGGYAAALFNMGAGTLDVNTLELGVVSSASAVAPVTGTLNIASGHVLVNSNNLALGITDGSTALATGTLTLSNSATLTVGNGFGIIDSGRSASAVTVENSSLAAANIGTSAAPIGSLDMGDSTLNLAANTPSGAVFANSITTDSQTNGIVINITSISQLAGLSPVITLIQSGTAIAGNGVVDFKLGTLPSLQYGGYLQTTANSVQLVLTNSPYAAISWTGADLAGHNNTNWSDGLNWAGGAEPQSTSPAVFNNAGSVGSGSQINNIVDGNVSVLELTYANTNGTFQNTLIGNNDSLTVGLSGLTVGGSQVDRGNTTGHVTISGGAGTLNVSNSSAEIYVGLGHTNASSTAQATLDMSGLANFNASVASFLVGVSAVGPATVLQSVGTVSLARTNIITASSGTGASDSSLVAMDIGDAGDGETAAGYGNSMASAVYLGETNAIFADYITVGRQFASGGLFFNHAFANPTVYIRGASANAVTVWNIADGAQNTLSAGGGSGTNDFTGGSVNALVNTLQIGKGSSGYANTSSAELGTLTFDAGTIVADTVNISYNPAYTDGNVYNYAVGTVNVDGTASLVVNNTLNMAWVGGAPASTPPSATLNIDGGSVWANSLAPGTNTAVSTININGGTLTVSNGGIGTVPLPGAAAVPLTSLNVTNATINVGAVTAPILLVGNVSASGTNTINLLSVPPIETYPAVLTILNSASAIGGAAANFRVVFPAVGPGSNAYAGTLSESGDSKSIVVTLTSGPIGTRGIVIWTGPDVVNNSINWTDPTNWFSLGAPGPNDTAILANYGATGAPGAANVDNIVNVNIQVGSLWYSETNIPPAVSYRNTVITNGATLSVVNTNAAIVLDAGTQSDPAIASGATTCYNTISGAGTLAVTDANPESVIIVSQGSSTYAGGKAGDNLYATLDMSGLAAFDATVGRLLIGVEGVGPTPGEVTLEFADRQSGQMSLAETNVIHLTQVGNIQGTGNAAAGGPALVILDDIGFGDYGSVLNLGQSNALYTDTITVGRNGSLRSAVLQFNTAVFPSSSLYLRGESSNRVSEFVVADGTLNGNASQYESPDSRIVVTPQISGGFNDGESAVVDLSAGSLDVMIDTLIVAKGFGSGGGGYVVALFNTGTGTLNANTLLLGAMSSAAGDRPVTGILNVPPGGALVVNDQLALGHPFSGGTSPFAYGILNVGGTVAASAISSGGPSSIQVTNGTLSLTSVAGSIGTVAAPIGSLTLGNSTLNLAIGGSASPVVTSNLTFVGTNDLINVTELPLIDSAPATVTLIQQVGSPIVGADFVLGPLPAGYVGTLQMSTDNTEVQLALSKIPTLPTNGTTITGISLQAATSTLLISGTNGLDGGVYYVLTSTNLTVWTPIATNTFDGSGHFSATVPYSASDSDRFYKIESQ